MVRSQAGGGGGEWEEEQEEQSEEHHAREEGGVVQSLLRGSLLCASFPSVNISSNQDSVAYNIQHFETILENTKV